MRRKWFLMTAVIILLLCGLFAGYSIMKKKILGASNEQVDKDNLSEEKKKIVESFEKFKLLIEKISKGEEKPQSFIDYLVTAGVITSDKKLVSDPSIVLSNRDFGFMLASYDMVLIYDEESPEIRLLTADDFIAKDASWNITDTKATFDLKRENSEMEFNYHFPFVKKNGIWYVSIKLPE